MTFPILQAAIARDAGRNMAVQEDMIIAKAIAKALGPDTLLESLRGRLTSVSYAGSENRTLCLDGRPLIEFYPLESSMDTTDGRYIMNLSQPYRLFDWKEV